MRYVDRTSPLIGYRHGSRRAASPWPGDRSPGRRVRAADGFGELPVPAYEPVAGTDLLAKLATARLLAGRATRRYRAEPEPVGAGVEQAATATSGSAVSRKGSAGQRDRAGRADGPVDHSWR